jgi:acyl carrier protein
MTFDEFAIFLAQALELEPPITLQPTTGLYDELGLESLQAFQMVIAIETRAGLEIPEDDVPELYTLGDAYEYFCRIESATRDLA